MAVGEKVVAKNWCVDERLNYATHETGVAKVVQATETWRGIILVMCTHV